MQADSSLKDYDKLRRECFLTALYTGDGETCANSLSGPFLSLPCSELGVSSGAGLSLSRRELDGLFASLVLSIWFCGQTSLWTLFPTTAERASRRVQKLLGASCLPTNLINICCSGGGWSGFAGRSI